jgi:hypothetical protein
MRSGLANPRDFETLLFHVHRTVLYGGRRLDAPMDAVCVCIVYTITIEMARELR